MKRLMIVGFLAAGLAAAGCKSSNGDAEGQEVKLDPVSMTDVPTLVRDAFKRDHPNAQVKEVEKETYPDGTVHYEFEYVENGKEGDVEYTAAGKVAEHGD